MEFRTLAGAENNQPLCGTCGRPKVAVEAIFANGKARYVLVRCDKRNCRVHCSKLNGCKHRKDPLVR